MGLSARRRHRRQPNMDGVKVEKDIEQSASIDAPKPVKTVDYTALEYKELKEIAKSRGIRTIGIKKDRIIQSLQELDRGGN